MLPPVYGVIFTYIAPLSIFLLLLNVNRQVIKQASASMIVLFLGGTLGTSVGVLLAHVLLGYHFEQFAAPIAGMITGTYTGGSINFNAVALHYEMNKEGALYTAIVAVDNILTTLWMLITLMIPKAFGKALPPTTSLSQQYATKQNKAQTFKIEQWALLALLGLFAVAMGQFINEQLAQLGWVIPVILIVTTLALILAQFKGIANINISGDLGLFLMYLFLAVIGAYCDLAALTRIGETVLIVSGYLLLVIVVHFSILLAGTKILKWDAVSMAVASQANIGGSSSAIALAKSLKQNHLLLPAILIGILGNGIGTYLGFLMAALV
jgi:uncharacterized membrane protein